MNTPDMSVFIGSGFDLEQKSIGWNVYTMHNRLSKSQAPEWSNKIQKGNFRPRLNKEQVLDGYSFIKSLEGFVWDVRFSQNLYGKNKSSKNVIDAIKFYDGNPEWLSFKGVRQGSIYEAWARQNDIPVINDDEEVGVMKLQEYKAWLDYQILECKKKIDMHANCGASYSEAIYAAKETSLTFAREKLNEVSDASTD